MTTSIERVQATPRWKTPGPQPNGLQAVPEGMWVIDQDDLYVYLLDWQDGSVLKKFPTETYHSSGITWDGEAIWVASTFTPIELFRYAPDGTELKRLPTPGASEKSGAHGMEWIDGKLWVTVPPSATTYQLDPEMAASCASSPRRVTGPTASPGTAKPSGSPRRRTARSPATTSKATCAGSSHWTKVSPPTAPTPTA